MDCRTCFQPQVSEIQRPRSISSLGLRLLQRAKRKGVRVISMMNISCIYQGTEHKCR